MRAVVVMLAALLAGPAAAQDDSFGRADDQDPRFAAGKLRHRVYERDGVPDAYAGKRNLFPADEAILSAGRGLYIQHCGDCHGPDGMGDGDDASALSPSPAMIGELVQSPGAADEYLLWSISDGGRQFATRMPAFKGKLTENQIWAIVTYLRAGLPPAE